MNHKHHITALIAALLLSLVATSALAEQAAPDVPDSAYAEGAVDGDNARVETRLLIDANRVKAGDTVRVGVLYTLDPGWHIYWRNSGDAGLGTDTDFAAERADIGELQWPAPHVFEEKSGDIHTFGYADQVLFFADAKVAPDAKGSLQVSAEVDYLACKEGCLPGNATLKRSVPIGPKTEPAPEAVAALFEQALSQVPRTPDELGVAVQTVVSPKPVRPGDEFRAAIGLNYCPERGEDCANYTVAFDIRDYAFIPDRSAQVSLEVVGLRRHPSVEHGQVLELAGKATAQDPRQDERLAGVIHLERDDGQMFSLVIDQPFPRGAAGADVAEVDSPLLQPVPEAAVAADTGGDGAGADARETEPAKGAAPEPVVLWKALLLAFLGGMILNLMPCVFPVLAIKVSSFTRLVHESKSSIFAHGMAYTAGIVGSLVSLALVVVGLRAAGTQVGWGFQFQEPLFIVALCAILVLFALNLFGVFELSVAPNELADKTRQATGVRRSFGEGILAVILATPCSAPFLGTAVGFALTSNAVTILAIFATLGLGLAAPFVVLSLSPGMAKILPKPGAWMGVLKEVLGFALLGTVIWLFYILGQMAGVDGIVETLIFLSVLALAAWVFGKIQYRIEGAKKWAIAVLAAAAVGAVGYFVLRLEPAEKTVSAAAGEVEWRPWTEEAVQAELAEGRTVFVDFGADWCISCKVNERSVLGADEVEKLLRRDDIVTFKADWTNPDERIRKKLAEFGRGGVPMYLVYHPEHPKDPTLLPEVLTVDLVVDALGE